MSEEQKFITQSGSESIRGPLGWPYPLINAILQFIRLLQRRTLPSPTGGGFKIYSITRDEKGRIIEIVERVA